MNYDLYAMLIEMVSFVFLWLDSILESPENRTTGSYKCKNAIYSGQGERLKASRTVPKSAIKNCSDMKDLTMYSLSYGQYFI
jgi:hypothetical protein